ncbi:MAG TPA: tetratricopeptide repeat protein [Bryobacteraceae bacterium]
MTRHELKEQLQHDRFTDVVTSAVSFTSSHRRSVIQWSVVLGIVLVLAGGAWWYFAHARSVRQRDLAAAMAVVAAPIGPPNEFAQTFPTEQAKTQASLKALSGVVAKDGNSREGLIARYYLGTLKAQDNDTKGAESDLRGVADSTNPMSPLAKIALAQLYLSQKRTADAQGLLRSIVNDPTALVSKAQAQILLAQLDETASPKEAKGILQSIEKADRERPAVTRAADQLSSQLAK